MDEAIPKQVVLDRFDDVSGWSAIASGEAQLTITAEDAADGVAMRLDFDFKGGGGFVVARKLFMLRLPEAYAFHFKIRGAAPPNTLEFKLVDPTNQNVWRYQHEAFAPPAQWRPMKIRSSEIEFAWGPRGGGAMEQLAALEIALAAPPGGKGTLWIADLRFADETFRSTPQVQASSASPGHEPACAVDGTGRTSWRSDPADGAPWLLLDFQREREYGGLVIQWEPGCAARSFDVQTSDDGTH